MLWFFTKNKATLKNFWNFPYIFNVIFHLTLIFFRSHTDFLNLPKHTYEPRHDKPTKWVCSQRRLRSAWASAQSDQSMPSLCRSAWASTQSDQSMPRLIRVFADQPGHPPNLIRVFAVRMKKAWILSYQLSMSEDSDQTGRMPRLIWVITGCTVTLLVLSCRGSNCFIWPKSFHLHYCNDPKFSYQSERSGQTVQTQIRLHQEQSDQGLHCSPFHLHLLDAVFYGKATLFKF